jgi:hypothetical protein
VWAELLLLLLLLPESLAISDTSDVVELVFVVVASRKELNVSAAVVLELYIAGSE